MNYKSYLKWGVVYTTLLTGARGGRPYPVTLLLLVFCFGALSLTGCAVADRLPQGMNAAEYYEYALKRLEKEDYFEAKDAFQYVLFNFPGSEYMDDARYGLAEAYFGNDEYELALLEYRRLVNELPQSPYADDASYKIGLVLFRQSKPPALDQEKTREAIQAFRDFLEEYPNSELVPEVEKMLQISNNKLAEKTYRNGKLYLKTEDLEAARIYFREVITRYPQSVWAARSQFGLADSYYKAEAWEEALPAYQVILENYPQAKKLVEDARHRIEEIKERLSKDHLRAKEGTPANSKTQDSGIYP